MRIRILGISGSTSINLVRMATKNLSIEELKEVLVTTELSKAKMTRILMERGLEKEQARETAQTILNTRATQEAVVANNLFSAATNSVKNALHGLGAVIKAHPIMAIITAVTLAISVFEQFKQKSEEAAKEATQNALNGVNSLKSSLEDIDSYIGKINELKIALNSNDLSQSEATTKRKELLSIQEELIKKYGQEKDAVDYITESIQGETTALNNLQVASAKDYLKNNRDKIKDAYGYFNNSESRTVAMNNSHNIASIEAGYGDFMNIVAGFLSPNQYDKTNGETYFTGTKDEIVAQYDDLRDKIQRYIDEHPISPSDDSREAAWGRKTKKYLNDYLDNLSEARNKIVNDENYESNKKIYDTAVESIIMTSNKYVEYYTKVIEAKNAYTEALASGNQDRISQTYSDMRILFNEIFSLDFLDEDNVSGESIKNWFTNIQNQIDKQSKETPVIIDIQAELLGSNDSYSNKIKEIISQSGYTSDDIREIISKGDFGNTLSKDEQVLYDNIKGYIDLWNDVAQYTGQATITVEEYISALQKLGIVKTETESAFFLSTYRDDLDKTSNSISKLKTAYDKFLKGNLSDEELFKLIYDKDNGFPELSKYIGNLEEGFKAVAGSEIDKVLDKLAEVDIEGLSESDLETYNRLKQYLEDIKADFDDASAAQERFRNELSNSSNTIKSLVSMREEIEKNGKLSRDSVLTLLSDDKYRSIWKPLIENDVEGYTKAINDLIKQEEGNFNALAQQILKSESDNSINEKKKEISEFEKLYKVDLSNWHDLSADKKKELQNTNGEMLAKQKKMFQDFKRLYGVDVSEFSSALNTKQLLLEKFRLSEVFNKARKMVVDDLSMTNGNLTYYGKNKSAVSAYLANYGLSFQDLLNYMQNNTLPDSYFNKVNAQFNSLNGGSWFNFVDDILSNFDINNFYDDKNKSTNSTDTKQTLDWIERRLKKFAQTTKEVYADVEKYTNYTDQNSQLNKSISAIKNEIAANNSAYNSYMAFANAVDLSSDYKSKVQNGLLDIETIKDSDLRDKISKYQDLYDKAKSCKDTVESLIKTEKEYATQQLSNIEKYFDNRTNKAKNSLSYYNSTDTDNLFMKKNYGGLRDAYNRQITETENEAAQLRATLNSLSSQGLINSNEWYEWDSKISQLNVSIRELKKSLRDLTDEEMTHIKSYWDNRIGQSENIVSYINAIAGDGTRKSTKNYSGLRNAYNTQIGYISKEVSELQDKLDNGEIEKYSANWYKWTEIIAQGNQKIQELQANIHQLAVEQFNDIQTKYEHQLQSSQHTAKEYENRTKELETRGYLASTQLYQKLSDITQGNINTLKQQASELSTSLDNAVKSGNIEAGSEEWYKMRDAILSVNEQIDDSRIKIYEYTKTIREARWEVFDFVQDRISQITSESDFIIDVLSNSKLFGDDGNITSKGKATFGLHAQNYDVYMQQVKRYASEIVMVNAQLANDRNNTDIIQRREKLLELQQKSITAAEKEKKAIVDLTKNGFDEQLKSLKKLIDTYTKNLDATKSLYDYQNSISDKTSNISKLQKQLSAYAGDSSEETMAKMQKLQVELRDAQKDLQQTEYEKLISDTKSLLDNLYTDYEETLNKRLDDVDGLLNDTISTINTNSAEINSTLKSSMADVGYTISSEIQSVWNGKGVISDKIISVLDNISNNVANMVIASGNVGTYKKYATGGLVDYTGIAQVDGTPSKPELVLNSADTRNFVNLRDTLRQLSSQPLTMANGLGKFGLIGGAIIPSMLDISSKLPKLAYSGTNHNMNIHNENHIEIGIDKVEDYNDFIAKMQKDKRFEGIIQDMTFGRMNGGISLAKYRH